jgi:hypothetical protein
LFEIRELATSVAANLNMVGSSDGGASNISTWAISKNDNDTGGTSNTANATGSSTVALNVNVAGGELPGITTFYRRYWAEILFKGFDNPNIAKQFIGVSRYIDNNGQFARARIEGSAGLNSAVRLNSIGFQTSTGVINDAIIKVTGFYPTR